MAADGVATIARDAELDSIRALLAAAQSGLAGLLLEGEAGIGKTTLFGEALSMAESAGFRVLACRGAVSEAALSLAAVLDLLEPVPTASWAELPMPQQRALAVALLRAEPGEMAVEQRAIAAGVRSLIKSLADEQPVLLAIDDVQWLDDASVTVLEYVLRRLGPERVAVLGVRRLPEQAALDLPRLLPPQVLVRRRVGPLSLGAMHRLLQDRVCPDLPRSMLVRVHDRSGGNPLFALEIGRALADRGIPEPGAPLPVPDDMQALVQQRVAGLPAQSRDLLLAAALLATPEVEVLERLTGGQIEERLAHAERAGIARIEGDRVAFGHPLHAAAIIAGATVSARRRMHARLADAVSGIQDQARHLSFAVQAPDAHAAEVLAAGADVAQHRGALHEAAELFEHAGRLTPAADAPTATGRGIRAAELYAHAGDPKAALAMLDALQREPLTPTDSAEVLRIRAQLSFADNDLPGSARLLEQALELDPSALRCRLNLIYISAERMDYSRAGEIGRNVIGRLDEATEGPLLAEALSYTAMSDFLSGHGIDWARIERALELEDRDRIPLMGRAPHTVGGLLSLYDRQYDDARRRLLEIRDAHAERGDEDGYAQIWLSFLETQCGNFSDAAEHGDVAIALAALAGNTSYHGWALAQRSWVDVHLGDLTAAKRRLDEAARDDERGMLNIGALWTASALALAGLSVGNPAAAWDGCGSLIEGVELAGLGEPAPFWVVPDAVEALIGLGQLDRAERLLEMWEERGHALGHTWVLATGGRARAVLLTACGDPAGAIVAAEHALVLHEHLGMPFDRARALLVKGIAERRARRWGDARRSLRDAAAEFERLGTPLWAGKARDELSRLGARATRDDQALTASESRVVELAVQGHSNKEIAAALSISPHTVERHLSHSYAKLGVTRRSQLAGRIATNSA